MTECKIYDALKAIPKSNEHQISLLSFNILRKDMMFKHDSDSKYPYCNVIHKKWNYRVPKILDIIYSYKSDVVCLQECAPYSFKNEFVDILNSDKYGCNYDYIVDKKKARKDETSIIVKPAILWNINKFKMIYHEFRSRPCILLLQIINNNSYLFIINVHLIGNYLKSEYPQRFSQMKSVLKRIPLICGKYKINIKSVPIIICGDFNSEKNEIIDKMLLDGIVKKDYVEIKHPNIKRAKKDCKTDYQHPYSFADAYNYSKIRPPTIASYDSARCIDFIYYTKNNIRCKGISQTVPLFMQSQNKINLPTHQWPSDHLPISCLLEIKKQYQEINDNSTTDWVFHPINSF